MPSPTTTGPHRVGDPVQVRHRGQLRSGRIRSVHHQDHGIEYVITTDPVDGGMGEVLNVSTTSGRSVLLGPGLQGGGSR